MPWGYRYYYPPGFIVLSLFSVPFILSMITTWYTHPWEISRAIWFFRFMGTPLPIRRVLFWNNLTHGFYFLLNIILPFFSPAHDLAVLVSYVYWSMNVNGYLVPQRIVPLPSPVRDESSMWRPFFFPVNSNLYDNTLLWKTWCTCHEHRLFLDRNRPLVGKW
jgi:hypothetical protein